MNAIGLIVCQGNVPCGLYNAAANKLGGVLIPATADTPVVVFTQGRDAKRAITRTARVAEKLKGSLIDDWLRLSPLLSGQPYTILPVTKSHAKETKASRTS